MSTTDRFVNERAPWFFFECVKIDILNTKQTETKNCYKNASHVSFQKYAMCGELGWTKETKKRSATKRTSWSLGDCECADRSSASSASAFELSISVSDFGERFTF